MRRREKMSIITASVENNGPGASPRRGNRKCDAHLGAVRAKRMPPADGRSGEDDTD